MPKGVIFLPSYYQAISDFPVDERCEMYDAIVQYGLFDIEPEFNSFYLSAVFEAIRPNIDSTLKRYEAAVENGKKGGAPFGNQNARKHFGLDDAESTKNNPRTTLSKIIS